MDALANLDDDFLPDLKELKNDLESSSENESEMSESNSELGKRDRSETDYQKGQQQQLILRKRDVKGNYKAKFNIEKLMIEHEKKQIQLEELNDKYSELQDQLSLLRNSIGKKVQSGEDVDQKTQSAKCHWSFLLKEMKWMAEDFERETKKKLGDSKKHARACKKELQEKKLRKEKELKDQKIELRKKAVNMSRMVQQFWRSVDKVVRHNYNVLYEKKRQQIRTKKLENFVSKHLKLSVKVAEELNTKAFVDQSMYNKEGEADQAQVIVKLYDTQDEVGHQRDIELINTATNDQVVELKSSKRRRVSVIVKREASGGYSYDSQIVEHEGENQQQHSQAQDKEITRALIAEQTVEMAKALQPQGFTLSSVNVKTKVPFLLHGSLREYQIIGLDWLVTLHNKKLNGILADEMGLGKTIQTIAMLASLACEKGVWGPHLIVVPTTIIINWEMEFKKWCPAFKILTYFGSQKERKMKRHGWSKDNSFHVCITSYKLVIQDHFAFRRKKWYYMVLDEAQNIKNFKSQRWQTLLRFNTKRRLLLTGTPLQNDVMELWSLMHFLMPNIFSSQQDFKEWFSNPFTQSINQNQTLNISVVQKLQSILRPFLLRRMKRDVEKQLPEKIEHIVQCNLSRRQRLLYDEYINSDKTKQTLHDTDFFSIMNVLMQLRKVCNHPDLFEPRSIESPFIMQDRIRFNFSSLIYKALQHNPLKDVSLQSLSFVLGEFESLSRREYESFNELYPRRPLIQVIGENRNHLDDLSHHLMNSRPSADGYSYSRRMPVNCNVFATSNTKPLKQTLSQVLPYETNIFHEVPSYLNTACLPFTQHHYSLGSYDEMRFSQRTKEYSEYDSYFSALQSDEQRLQLLKFAAKLVQWRQIDQVNRTNLIFKKPVYGEDCRRMVKINFLFGDVFELRRHKNLDRYSAQDFSQIQDLSRAASAVFNPFAQRLFFNSEDEQDRRLLEQNTVEDWPEQTEDEIESYNLSAQLVKEVPMSQQLSNKKRKKQLKELMKLREQEDQVRRLEEEERRRAERLEQIYRDNSKENIPEEEKLGLVRKFTLILNMRNVREELKLELENQDLNGLEKDQEGEKQSEIGQQDEEMKDEELNQKESIEKEVFRFSNPNVEVIIRKVKIEELEVEQLNEEQKQDDQEMKELEQPVERELNPEGTEVAYPEQLQIVDQEKMDLDQGEGLLDFNSGLSTNQQPELIQQTGSQNAQEPEQQLAASPTKNQSTNASPSRDQEQELQIDTTTATVPSQSFKKVETPYSQSFTYKNCEVLKDLIVTPLQRVSILEETIRHFKFIIPKAVANTVDFVPSKIVTQHQKEKAHERFLYQKLMSHRNVNQSLKFSNILFFPHKNLIQYDCGKLQRLAMLLKNLHSKGHKVLIFTQMTRILDILEQFLNLHGYSYVRLDGSVKVEMRQRLVDKFNLNKKIFCFISSTRCGGIGINLTGADCVIFYDTDWNPAMDKQAQDRCHRIGQTKTVHIYRLISVNTIEENIFKKSLQKRDFGGLIIEGGFDMEFFKKVSLKDLLEEGDLGDILRPKRRNLIKEDNIVFHSNDQNLGLADDYEAEAVNEFDWEKQREIESYRRKFEEALVRIEDKEDVFAYQQAKREIDDEFDEEAILAQDGGQSTTKSVNGSTAGEGLEKSIDGQSVGANPEEGQEEELDQAQTQFDDKGASQLQSEMRKNEFINWRSHATLNEVTKMCIEYFEHGFSFEQYLEDRAKKDAKFINPLKDEEEQQEKQGAKKKAKSKGEEEDAEGSEFSFSEDEDQASQGDEAMENVYERAAAEALYKGTRNEIVQRYFVM